MSKICFTLTVLNLSLKMQGKLQWSGNGIIWPIYIGLGFCFIITVGITLFTLGSFVSCLNKEITNKEFIFTMWVFLSIIGASSSILLVSWHFTGEKNDYFGDYFLVFPIVYLFFFGFSLAFFIKHVVEWWKFFFSYSDDDEALEITTTNGPGNSNLSFQQRAAKAIKKTPHLLMRISSSYFQPMPSPKKTREKKTTSFDHSVDIGKTTHRRIFSAPEKTVIELKGLSENPKPKACSLCCEKISDSVIMNCGHGGICYDCSLELWKSTGACHMCRAEISQVLQVELVPKEILKVCSTTSAVYNEI